MFGEQANACEMDFLPVDLAELKCEMFPQELKLNPTG